MVKAAKIYESTEIKKKKKNLSKNKKKAWKQIDLSAVEDFLEGQETEERVAGCLGDKSSDEIFDLDLDLFSGDVAEKENEPTKKRSIKKSAPIKVEYTIDETTGLKKTDKPKQTKLIHEHRFLDGLPGVKNARKAIAPVKKEKAKKLELKVKAAKLARQNELQKLKENQVEEKGELEDGEEKPKKVNKKLTSEERKQAAILKRLQNPKQVQKLATKKLTTFITTKKSKTIKKLGRKKIFDKNIWAEETATPEETFCDDALDHMKRNMKKKFINNRGFCPEPNTIPKVILPAEGMSYNPDFKSHQDLLRKAHKEELDRREETGIQKMATTVGFPQGACQVDAKTLISDMNPELRSSGGDSKVTERELTKKKLLLKAKKAKGKKIKSLEVEEPLPVKKSTERKTHSQRLKEIRHKTKLIQHQEKKLAATRLKDFNKLDEIDMEIMDEQAELEAMMALRKKKFRDSKHKKPRFFLEKPMDIALSEELHGSLRQVMPPSNLVKDSISHIYRRGLLPALGKKRKYETGIKGAGSRRVKGKAVEMVTEENIPTETKRQKKYKNLGKKIKK